MQTASYNRALNFYNKGNYSKAGYYLDKAIKKDKKNAEALFLKGKIAFMGKRDLSLAEDLVRQAISLSPQVATYYLSLGVIYIEQKKSDKAIEALNHCLELSPKEGTAKLLLADIYRFKAGYAVAYDLYREVDDLGKLPPIGHFCILSCLACLDRTGYTTAVEKNILDFLRQDLLEHGRFTKFICSFFKNKYCLDQYDSEVDINVLVGDELFHRMLTQMHISDPALELFLTELRKIILLECLENSGLSGSGMTMVRSLSEQSYNNEYVFLQDDEEREMVAALETFIGLLLKQETLPMAQLDCAVLVLSMYKLLHDSAVAGELLAIPLQSWPEKSQKIIKLTLFDIADELQRAQSIPRLGDIKDHTSQSVQLQYESNPYPRWIRINDVNQKLTLSQHIQMEITDRLGLPEFLNRDDLKILVAGCGSGRQPLQLGIMFPNSKITAVDLSRRSLAYGQRMGEIYGVKNVDFLHGDILGLDQLQDKFHVLCCTGVLHHMHDPMAGWEVLKRRLLPAGLMKIGLYSEIARESLTRIKNTFLQQGIEVQPEAIRLFRRQIIHQRTSDKDCASVTKSGDFYSLSSCRDLLFHVQEHRFTIPQLEACLQDLNLRFLGFHADLELIYEDYSKRYPEDVAMTSLVNWHAYEQIERSAFTRMYQFWCQLKD